MGGGVGGDGWVEGGVGGDFGECGDGGGGGVGGGGEGVVDDGGGEEGDVGGGGEGEGGRVGVGEGIVELVVLHVVAVSWRRKESDMSMEGYNRVRKVVSNESIECTYKIDV